MMLSNGKVAKMPDKKLTDSEIVKALECCGKAFIECDCSHCNKCPYTGKARCQGFLLDNTLGLINRLKKYDEERDIRLHARLIEEAKAEAYKECIEKINKIICDNTYPDFDKNGKAVNIWKAKTGYAAIDDLLLGDVGCDTCQDRACDGCELYEGAMGEDK